jgi:ABC-type Fe3+-hydroxamate transport system substrate-binding protein
VVASIHRRSFVLGAAALIAAPSAVLAGRDKRLVTLEWTATEIALLLGLQPAGVAELDGYRSWVAIDNEGLSHSVDLGRRQQPSLEAIRKLSPDLILSSKFRHAALEAKLSEITDVELLDDQPADGDMLAAVFQNVRQVGMVLERTEVATALLADFESRLDRTRTTISKNAAGRTVLVAQPLPGVPRLRVFARNSAIAMLLARIGLPPAIDLPPQPFGFTTIDLEGLAMLDGQSTLVILSDTLPVELAQSGIWPLLPVVANGRVIPVGSAIWPFGSVGALTRLADKIVDRIG